MALSPGTICLHPEHSLCNLHMLGLLPMPICCTVAEETTTSCDVGHVCFMFGPISSCKVLRSSCAMYMIYMGLHRLQELCNRLTMPQVYSLQEFALVTD